jgi:hypothetical protein
LRCESGIDATLKIPPGYGRRWQRIYKGSRDQRDG